jgi:hypothetical protein
MKGICGIAIGAPEIAAGQADKDARQARAAGLSLDTMEDLVDNELWHEEEK